MHTDRDIAILREVIVKLTQMLAGMGLRVTQQGAQAYVESDKNGKPVRVNIPYIPDGASEGLILAIQGFIDHEVAHILFTDWASVIKAYKTSQRLGMMHNIVEDPRIETAIGKKFPGSVHNLGKLHEFFIANITEPGLEKAKAKSPQDEFGVLVVPIVRAWAGQKAFKDWLDRKKHWDHPYVKAFVDQVKPSTIAEMPGMKDSWDALRIAEEFIAILHPPVAKTPPSPTPPESKECEDGKKGKGKAPHKEKPEPSEDDEEGESEGAGGSASGSAKEADDEDGEGEASKPEKSEKPEKSKKPEKSEDADEDEGSDADEDGDEGADDGEDADGGESRDEDGEDADEEAEGAGGSDEEEDEDAEAEDDETSGSGAGEDESEEDGGEDEAADGEDEGEEEDGEADGSERFDEDSLGESSAEEEDASAEPVEAEGGRGAESEAGGPPTFVDVEISGTFEDALTKMITDEASRQTRDADYRVFSKDFDVIQNHKVSDYYQDRWLTELDDKTRHMVGVMQKDVERMMAQRSRVVQIPGFRSGRLHSSGLHRLMVNDDRVFRRKQEANATDTVVGLLVDNSGSMRGSKTEVAMSAAFALSMTLERVRISHECIGFTTTRPGSGHSYAVVRAEETRLGRSFSRSEAVLMPIYKGFDERLTPAVKKRFADVVGHEGFLANNIDGEAVEVASQRLLQRKEKRKVLIVLSDGFPSAAGIASELYSHLHKAVDQASKAGIEVIGIGIQSNAVKTFYPKHVVLNDLNKLPSTVMGEIKRILTAA